jgi:hypothetical protein
MKQCQKWQECGVTQCHHYGDHEENSGCSLEEYCIGADCNVKCVEIVGPVPVEKKMGGRPW